MDEPKTDPDKPYRVVVTFEIQPKGAKVNRLKSALRRLKLQGVRILKVEAETPATRRRKKLTRKPTTKKKAAPKKPKPKRKPKKKKVPPQPKPNPGLKKLLTDPTEPKTKKKATPKAPPEK